MMAIEIKQSSKRIAPRRWRWAVWLDGDPQELATVEQVVYYLHPTFRNPVRKITTASNNFRLSASGWGVFTLGIEIHQKGGTVETREHDLTFEERLETKEAEETEPQTPRRLLLLNESEDVELSRKVAQALKRENVEVLTATELGGGTWSEELIEALRKVDAVLSVGAAHEGSYRIEARAAEKLGKQVLQLGTKERDVEPEPFHALSHDQLTSAAGSKTRAKLSKLIFENLKPR